MKIAHEAPLQILEWIRELTDYDYCLVHLLDSEKKYLEFFKKSLSMGREVILDNSIFELGESFDSERFAYWVNELKPTSYIIPDVLESCEGTITNLMKWVQNYNSLPGKKIGVVQGKTYEEIVNCYATVDKYCDKIAISFDYSLYKKLFPHQNEIVSWTFGRILLINMLLRDSVINIEKPHHLLGCASPSEFSFYKGMSFIESVDTSSPIVHGLLGIKYPENGLWKKERVKLVELIHAEVNLKQKKNILFNIMKFNKIAE